MFHNTFPFPGYLPLPPNAEVFVSILWRCRSYLPAVQRVQDERLIIPNSSISPWTHISRCSTNGTHGPSENKTVRGPSENKTVHVSSENNMRLEGCCGLKLKKIPCSPRQQSHQIFTPTYKEFIQLVRTLKSNILSLSIIRTSIAKLIILSVMKFNHHFITVSSTIRLFSNLFKLISNRNYKISFQTTLLQLVQIMNVLCFQEFH